jgi:TPR repeat protein
MKTNRVALLVVAFFAALPFAAFAQNKTENAFSGDPQIVLQYVPGKYYEQRALDAVKRKNFRQALEMYQKAGYWGNKVAQYDVGMLYLNGAQGVAVDKIRGIAWLGIAAQRHVPYVDQALGDAYSTATAKTAPPLAIFGNN